MSSRWASLLVVPLVAAAAAIDANWKVVNMLVSLSALALPALFLGTVQRPESLLGRLLELPAVAWLGKISLVSTCGSNSFSHGMLHVRQQWDCCKASRSTQYLLLFALRQAFTLLSDP